MTPEELLKVLHDGGMDDKAIQTLLSDTLASLSGPAEGMNEEQEKEKAGDLLGVAL